MKINKIELQKIINEEMNHVLNENKTKHILEYVLYSKQKNNLNEGFILTSLVGWLLKKISKPLIDVLVQRGAKALQAVLPQLPELLNLDDKKSSALLSQTTSAVESYLPKLKSYGILDDNTENIVKQKIASLKKISENKISSMLLLWLSRYTLEWLAQKYTTKDKKTTIAFLGGLSEMFDSLKNKDLLIKSLKEKFNMDDEKIKNLDQDINQIVSLFSNQPQISAQAQNIPTTPQTAQAGTNKPKNTLKTYNPPTKKEPQGSYDVDLDEQIKKHFKKFI